MTDLKVLVIAHVTLIPLIIFWVTRRKRLEKNLLKHGVEMLAKIEHKGMTYQGTTEIDFSFECKGAVIRKTLFVATQAAEKEVIPVLVNPKNPKQFFLNIKKNDLNVMG